MHKITLFILALNLILSCTSKEDKVLVYSKTEEFRHGSIESGIKALQKLGLENNFIIEATEDSNYFTEGKLKNYATVIFLNTTGTF